MKRAFRDSYNRELALLKERAAEFAQEFPGLADRLGGLLQDNMDPTVAGLLEGSAFLAARVQLKIDEEFRTFTEELLEQVFPDALAPTPSVMLVRASVPAENSGIEDGLTFESGAYMDARFLDADKRVACRFALASPLTLWPIALTSVAYHDSTGPLSALGREIVPGTRAGLVMDLARISPSGQISGSATVSSVSMDVLNVHLTGPLPEAAALYEQIFAGLKRISLRWMDKQGDPAFATLPLDAVEQIGFEPGERLFPHNERLFDGFALLREFFIFPRKFAGFRIKGLAQYIKRMPGSSFQVFFEFRDVNPILAARMEASHLVLHAAPAVNLFEEMSSQVRLDQKHTEFVVTPNSTPVTHYEFHAITEVWAFYRGHQNKVRVYPLYAVARDTIDARQLLYFTARRKPRRMTTTERRFGAVQYRYRGTETFISLYEPPEKEGAHRIQVRGLCSNRHLAEYLPIAQSVGEFHMSDEQTVSLACIAGPTPPRDSLADLDIGAAHRARAGDVYWRLMSYLSLNQQGLDGTDAAAAIREMMSLFADLSDTISEAQIRGLCKVATRPINRMLAMRDGYYTVRGMQVELTFDENEFEGTGVLFLGAVLDRFLSEYAAVNSFTQVVINSLQRGHLKTWSPRSGSGPIL